MSPRPADDDEKLTPGDWARYGGLLALATLVLLVIVGRTKAGVVILVAVYLVLACVALLVVQVRRRRS